MYNYDGLSRLIEALDGARKILTVMLMVGFIGMILMLAGCNSVKEVPVSVKDSTVVNTKIPEHLLKHCAVPPPPQREKYLASTYAEKEYLLANYIGDILTEVGICNSRIDQIKLLNQ